MRKYVKEGIVVEDVNERFWSVSVQPWFVCESKARTSNIGKRYSVHFGR